VLNVPLISNIFEILAPFPPPLPPPNVAEANVLQGCCATSLKNVGLANASFKLRAKGRKRTGNNHFTP